MHCYLLNRTITYFSFLNRLKSSSSVTTSKDADSTLFMDINSNDIITIKFIFIKRRMVNRTTCHSSFNYTLPPTVQISTINFPIKFDDKKA